ncbi:MAG: hypothetical protein Q4E47_03300 [Candidatus Saccharibacteria bacterium]|nr:hypothetical protein [Candidatus Saccharibacteria bacterium]
MILDYKASNIANAERESGQNFFEIISHLGDGNTSISDLLFIWHCGGGDNATFDETFKKGLAEVLATIMEAINEAGFLGQKIDVAKLRQEMEQPVEISRPSQKSGRNNKS